MLSVSPHCAVAFKKAWLAPRHWLTWLIVFFIFLLSLLPTSMRHWMGTQLGHWSYRQNTKRRHIIRRNLQLCFPELSSQQHEKLVRENFRYTGMAYLDYSILFFASKKRLAKLVEIEGFEHIEKAKAENKNVMFLFGHSVMLEFTAIPICEKFDCCGSYKHLSNPIANWFVARGRCRYGKSLVSRKEGFRRLIKEGKRGRLLFFLPDEDHGEEHSIFAPFFAAEKATLTTPPRLARMTKAVALPLMGFWDEKRRKYRIMILPALENYPSKNAKQDAIKLNQAMETLIQYYPEQYMWMLKIFKTRPNGEKAVY